MSMSLCMRCNEQHYRWQDFSHRQMTDEKVREMMYCHKCVTIIRFENNKFVKCPYKKPIDRKGIE